jgi:hypothetical protein
MQIRPQVLLRENHWQTVNEFRQFLDKEKEQQTPARSQSKNSEGSE